MDRKILVTGALGQIGSELATKLAEIYGSKNVIITDIRDVNTNNMSMHYEQLDVNDVDKIQALVSQYKITDVYHLAAMLSATAEKYPIRGWSLNTNSLLYFLELAKDKKIKKLFWPSSIAIYGRGARKRNTPQEDVKNPLSMYGIAKDAGEGFCELYYNKYGVDVRSIRYPGLISWKTPPGGGTTDYAVDIYYKALTDKKFTCFLSEEMELPMMYMEDAIRATVELMQAPKEDLTVRTAYNVQGMSFSPKEIAAEIKKHIPAFEIEYAPDYREKIANSWPDSIDDSVARKDWNWENRYDLTSMTEVMLKNLKTKLEINEPTNA